MIFFKFFSFKIHTQKFKGFFLKNRKKMIFDEILKDLQKGLHGKVLAEKLFENFSHTEIQPILKEIQ